MRFVNKFVFVMVAIVCCFESSQLLGQETETKVTLNQVPAIARTAIQKAVGEGKLIDIGEIKSNGKSTFEIEMHVGQQASAKVSS